MNRGALAVSNADLIRRLLHLAERLQPRMDSVGKPETLALVIEATDAIERQQAVIDRLMLEHCPDEMTEEQKAEWERHQKAI